MNGIEYFLSQRMVSAEHDRRGWEYLTLDYEFLHHLLLQQIINASSDFSKGLIGISGLCHRPSPLFDLTVTSDDGREACIEIKIDGKWSEHQCGRQVAYLSTNPSAQGFIVLLGNQACLSRSEVAQRSNNLMSKIGYSNLYTSLSVIQGEPGLCELAEAYRNSLQRHEARLRQQRKWEPNA